MKPLSDMTRLELAAFIGAEFKRRNINVVLTGASPPPERSLPPGQ